MPTVYLSFSSGLSGSFDAAVLVHGQIMAEHPDAELYLVDTHLASVAEGLLVHEALRQRDKGLTARERAEEARYFVDAEFMVEDLEALRRGGRIPGSVAYAGSKLDVKPMLTIAPDGKLSLAGVARGSVGRALEMAADEGFLALRGRVIAGAASDVFETEPLPAEDPLWDLDNFLITPHATPRVADFQGNSTAALFENIRRYRGGEPLLNRFTERDVYTGGNLRPQRGV